MKNVKNKIPVAILGATGMVGQKFVELLTNHPWFKIVALTASEKSQGKRYGEVVRWLMSSQLEVNIANIKVQSCLPILPCQLVFSALDSLIAGEVEEDFANHGYIVISNSSNHRMDPDVPLVIPEVNPEHLELVKAQKFSQGMIVTNPNCSVIGLSTAFKPLVDRFGIEKCHIMTMQAVSGAGYPGVASLDILDNVIPFISGEEEKIETEPLKILGSLGFQKISHYDMQISAQCNRVPVSNGHMACVSLKLRNPGEFKEMIDSWITFSGRSNLYHLPSSPNKSIIYLCDERHPQPKLHRSLEKGMAVSIGRLRKCPLYDWKFALLSHNTIRGAAGGAILNAELMVRKDLIPSNF